MAHCEEQWILDFLKSQPKCFFSGAEIARKSADRHTYEANPRWALPHLARLRSKELVDVNDAGQYRYMDPLAMQEKREKARNRMGR
jgi:hypothetical protein